MPKKPWFMRMIRVGVLADQPRQEAGNDRFASRNEAMKTARRIAAAKAVAVMAGLATMVLGVATGNLPVVFAAAAVFCGAGLLAAVADIRETEARCEATGRLHQMESAVEQGRCREQSIEERMAELRRYYAASIVGTASGRFSFVATTGSPCGCRGYCGKYDCKTKPHACRCRANGSNRRRYVREAMRLMGRIRPSKST